MDRLKGSAVPSNRSYASSGSRGRCLTYLSGYGALRRGPMGTRCDGALTASSPAPWSCAGVLVFAGIKLDVMAVCRGFSAVLGRSCSLAGRRDPAGDLPLGRQPGQVPGPGSARASSRSSRSAGYDLDGWSSALPGASRPGSNASAGRGVAVLPRPVPVDRGARGRDSVVGPRTAAQGMRPEVACAWPSRRGPPWLRRGPPGSPRGPWWPLLSPAWGAL
jgi:hypothetical protein